MGIEMTNGFQESRKSCMSLPITSEACGHGALGVRAEGAGLSVRQEQIGAGIEWR
jgi:hypothetical protein